VSFTDQSSNLVFLGVEPGDITGDFTFESRVEAGAVVVSAAGQENIDAASGVIAVLRFQVAGSAPFETVFPITITSVEFKQQYGESLQWTTGTEVKNGSLTSTKSAIEVAVTLRVTESCADSGLASVQVRAVAGACGIFGGISTITAADGRGLFAQLPSNQSYCFDATKTGYLGSNRIVFVSQFGAVDLAFRLAPTGGCGGDDPVANALASFQSLDTNNDNRLSPAEVAAGAPELNFAALDSNNDGLLKVPELFQATDASPIHAADTDGDRQIRIGELLRVIQFFNSQGYHCDVPIGNTEDGYVPGPVGNTGCTKHSADYQDPAWKFSLSELLRVIQIFNTSAYGYCPGATEDGFCPGAG
jgi:hypothetical protein